MSYALLRARRRRWVVAPPAYVSLSIFLSLALCGCDPADLSARGDSIADSTAPVERLEDAQVDEATEIQLLDARTTEDLEDAAIDRGVIDERDSGERSDLALAPDVGSSECDIHRILAENQCTSCHNDSPGVGGGQLDLVSEGLARRLINRPALNPSCADEVVVNLEMPEASLLLRTVAPERYASFGSERCRPARMPLASEAIVSNEDVACIEEWVRGLEEPDLEDPDVPVPANAMTVLTRVKFLLHGGALTRAELEQASDEQGELISSGLSTLVEQWIQTAEFKVKRRQFLWSTLQQTPVDGNYFNQFRNTRTNNLSGVRTTLEESLIRTAERIIDDHEDFRSIITTNEWEVTTLGLLALKMADNPMELNNRGVWVKHNPINDIRYVIRQEGFYDTTTDAEDWRTVTLVHNPLSTDMTEGEDFEDPASAQRLRAIPDGGSVELRAPRIGFFTSPAFFQTWLTNVDNDFRVIINQAMIVATGKTFTPGDTTHLNTDAEGLDLDLFPVGSECYGCHKNLDPMRNAFLQTYDPINTRFVTPATTPPPADFAFQGHSVEVNGLHHWAEALASHPHIAKAWVLKLCQWANTIACDGNHETVIALASDFENSGFDMTHLIKRFFTSPFVTETSDREGTRVPGAQVSVARKGHYCRALYVRLSEVRRAQGREMHNRLDVCNQNGDVEILSASLPEDSTVRGSIDLHQPKDTSPMIAVAIEALCSLSADTVVSARTNNAAFDTNDPARALDLMTEHMLGIPEGTERFTEQRQRFQTLYEVQTLETPCADPAELQTSLTSGEPLCGLSLSPTDALRNIWIMVCQSPSLTGVGL